MVKKEFEPGEMQGKDSLGALNSLIDLKNGKYFILFSLLLSLPELKALYTRHRHLYLKVLLKHSDVSQNSIVPSFQMTVSILNQKEKSMALFNF